MAPLDIQPAPNVRPAPESVRRKLAELAMHSPPQVLEATNDLYRPIHRQRSDAGLAIARDLAYGPHERHRLDIFTPDAKPAAPMPAAVFFHGGGMVGGTKNKDGDFVHGHIASYFARHGIVGAIATYRLAPEVRWPEGGRDVGAVVAFLRAHAAEYGIDPERIFLFGESAGALHVATWAFRTDVHPAEGPGCAGVMLMSGPYEIPTTNPPPNIVAYYGEDTSDYARQQTLGHVGRADFPAFIIFTEFDLPRFQDASLKLAAELVEKHGRVPRIKQLLGHNHFSQSLSIGTEDPSIGPDLIDFVLTAR